MSAAIGAVPDKKLNNDKNIAFSRHADGELDDLRSEVQWPGRLLF
jgi:hypothetical protein